MKTYLNFINEQLDNSQIDELKRAIIEYYKISNNIDYSDSIEIEFDKKYSLYWIWVSPFSDTQLYKGKTGGSESHIKGRYPENSIIDNYDYIIMSNKQKTNDPYCWKEHEVGHILGYRKGYSKKQGNIIPNIIKTYPNVWDEYYPFYMQMSELLKNNSPEDTVRKIMVDYESNHNQKELKKIEEFVTMFLEKYFNK